MAHWHLEWCLAILCQLVLYAALFNFQFEIAQPGKYYQWSARYSNLPENRIGTKCYVNIINIRRSQDHLAIPEDRKYTLCFLFTFINILNLFQCDMSTFIYTNSLTNNRITGFQIVTVFGYLNFLIELPI